LIALDAIVRRATNNVNKLGDFWRCIRTKFANIVAFLFAFEQHVRAKFIRIIILLRCVRCAMQFRQKLSQIARACNENPVTRPQAENQKLNNVSPCCHRCHCDVRSYNLTNHSRHCSPGRRARRAPTRTSRCLGNAAAARCASYAARIGRTSQQHNSNVRACLFTTIAHTPC
jgi:hypothetical protein